MLLKTQLEGFILVHFVTRNARRNEQLFIIDIVIVFRFETEPTAKFQRNAVEDKHYWIVLSRISEALDTDSHSVKEKKIQTAISSFLLRDSRIMLI